MNDPNDISTLYKQFAATTVTVSCTLKRTRKIGDDFVSIEVMNSTTALADQAMPAETLGIASRATHAVALKTYLDMLVQGGIDKTEFDAMRERLKLYQDVK